METQKTHTDIVWLRRDLRLHDNPAIYYAIQNSESITLLFIFDTDIIQELPVDDARINFIYETLKSMNDRLEIHKSSLLIRKGNVIDIWKQLLNEFEIQNVYTNEDYEPYSMKRDEQVIKLLNSRKIQFHNFQDHVIQKPGTILKDDGTPYAVFTAFKKKWLSNLHDLDPEEYKYSLNKLKKISCNFPSKKDIGLQSSSLEPMVLNLSVIVDYHKTRDFPYIDTSYLGTYLRFGTISIRKVLREALKNETFLSELIWREFFIHVLYYNPHTVSHCFHKKYDNIEWLNNPNEFEIWCKGETGYPLVDAGMRQLNKTGFMHNRVRMVCASFLCKHLLIDWRWGEAYFAEKLLDYELASNVGNWQWVAGTGCDAAPYFRVFNPETQALKFDKNYEYISKWVPEYKSGKNPEPVVDHKMARERAINTYKKVF